MEQSSSKVFAETASPVIAANGAGSALFVINLCASMAPIAGAGKSLPGLEAYRLYQVSRAEDGRTRYRLRLGFFVSEVDAEKALAAVRSQYPTAFTACLADEDKKFARGFITEAAPTAAAPKPQMSVVVDNDSTRPLKALRISPPDAAPVGKQAATVAAPAAKQVAAPPAPTARPAAPVAATPKPAAKPAPGPSSSDSAIVEIDWEPPKAATPAPTAQAAAPVKAPVKARAESIEIEMSWEPPAPKKPAAPPAAPPVAAKPATPPQAAAKPAAPVKPRQEIAPPPQMTAKPAAPAPAVAKAPVAPAKIAASAPAKTGALELAATSAPLSSGATTGQHRGIVATLAPAIDSMDLSLATDSVLKAAASNATPAKANQPFHVGKGVDVPATELTLDVEQQAPVAKASAPTPAVRPAAPAAPVTPAAKSSGPELSGLAQALVKAKAAAPAAGPPAIAAEQRPTRPHVPSAAADLDSTQTIRALTDAELSDETQEKWFAIQLVVSDQPVNLDAMPHLDIFEAYRLYSIATAGSGRITHSLRIGFFREQVSAEAVSGYLKTFFPNPSIVRISVAEQARFKDPPEQPTAAAEPVQDGKVVALSDARARKPVIPTVTMEVEAPLDTGATGSFKPNATGSFKSGATGSFKTGATGSFKPNATGSFKTSSTGSFKPNATGSFKPDATGSFKPTATGSFKAAGATGAHKAMKSAAKSAVSAKRSSAAVNVTPSKKSATGKHPVLPKKKLSEELREEAREVELSESGIFHMPKNNSLLSRLVDKLTRDN